MSDPPLSVSEILSRPSKDDGFQTRTNPERDADTISLPDRFKDDAPGNHDQSSPSRNLTLAFAQHSLFGVIAAAQPNDDSASDWGSAGAPDDADGSELEDRDIGDELFADDMSKAVPDLRASEPALRHGECRTRVNVGAAQSMVLESSKKNASAVKPAEDPAQNILDNTEDIPRGHLPLPSKTPTQSASMSTLRPVDTSESMVRDTDAASLGNALQDIFQLDLSEGLIAEHPCWYLQNALLQGFIYITRRHVCFYACLPPTGDDTLKSGHLSKRGKSSSRYRRFYFTLKGTVLSYFTSNAALYYPSGNIDLRNAVSADLGHDQDELQFSITTERRTYYLKADSQRSAADWVRSIRAVMDRSQNDADSIKIALPIDNILDVEDCPVIDAGDTIRIRVVDNDETFAVDEYFFTFFGSSGKDVLHTLGKMVQESTAFKALTGPERSVTVEGSATMSPIADVSPLLSESARISSESSRPLSRLSDMDRTYQARDDALVRPSQISHNPSVSEASPVPSTDSSQHLDPSASIILSGDTVFRDPTLASSNDAKKALTINTSHRNPVRPDMSESSRSSSPGQASLKSRPETQPITAKLSQTSTVQPVSRPVTTAVRPKTNRSMSYTESLGGFVRAGTQKMRRANDLASMLRAQSKRVSTLVGRSSKGYYEKVYGMWTGGKKHYANAEGLFAEDHVTDPEEEADAQQAEVRFREYFALPPSERLTASFFGHILRVLPLYGKLYMGTTTLCFRSLLPGTRTKLVLPFKDIMTVGKEKGFRFGYSGMVVVVRGHEEIFFEFADAGLRDDCTVTVLRSLEVSQDVAVSNTEFDDEVAARNKVPTHGAIRDLDKDLEATATEQLPLDLHAPTFFDDPDASMLEFKPEKSLNITCLTIGSRGDVQPYIALCKGLLAEGHKPKIATHKEFEPWVRNHGIEFARVDGDPAELMRICVENGMFTPSFLYEANSKFRGFLETLLTTSWWACQGSDVLIESPSAMAGIHIAEALGIPYFRAFTMPWTRTRAYPHAFAVPNHKMGGAYNYMTYVLFDNIFWQSTAGQINRWRRKVLGLHPTSLDKLQPNKVPFLYNFSPAVVMPPLDFSDWIRITGYWFLDEGSTWTPEPSLVEFIRQAREDKVPLVYIGFGSIVVSDSKAMTAAIVAAVLKADVRCILSKGWSDRLSRAKENSSGEPATSPKESLPDCIYHINSAPHDWLFSQIDCAVHHGGAGTTGASLRAGIPTLITPFFGDQFFFANRVQDLGVGLYVQRISEQQLGKALWVGTHDARMRKKAARLGEAIRREDGVGNAIKALWRDMEYANTLIKKREDSQAVDTHRHQTSSEPEAALTRADLDPGHETTQHEEGQSGGSSGGSGGGLVEESWTLIESDSEDRSDDLAASTHDTSLEQSMESSTSA